MKPGIDNVEWCDAIDKRLGALADTLKRIESKLSQSSSGGGAAAATDVDLDGAHGNPVIKKDPKRWTGASYAGCNFSDCPAEYLDVLAEFKDWQAGMDERKGTDDDKRKAKFNRLDASRARGWAQRIRGGYKAPVVAAPDDGDILF